MQVGHNVNIGENSILVAQVGISGSTKIGKNVIVAGQAGISGHLEIGDNARILAKTGVISNIEAGATVMGFPAMPHREFLRQNVFLRRLLKKN